MLLRYGVENHLSICDYQEISLAAAPRLKDDGQLLVVDSPGISGFFLPIIALYGANAAGKSNFMDALRYMIWCIRYSFRNAERAEEDFSLSTRPCKAGGAIDGALSTYDCDVLIDNVHYHYGFKCNKSGFRKEWLYSYPKGVKAVLFERDLDSSDVVRFGRSVGSVDKTLQELAANARALLLSSIGLTKHETLTPIRNYFASHFQFVETQNSRISEENVANSLSDDATRSAVENMLREADFGLVSLKVSRTPLPESSKQFTTEIFRVIKQFASDIPDIPERENLEITFVHRCENGREFEVPFSEESSGTRHFLSLLIPALDALRAGKVLIVDEVTTALHTKLSEGLVRLFSHQGKNKQRAQLLFTTHDTNLLSGEMLRRDEIWFVERDGEGKSHIYPLSDYKTRRTDNLEKGYLDGRFGAIPLLGSLQKAVEGN